MRKNMIALIVLAASFFAVAQEPRSVTIRADQPGHVIPKTLYGIFFEDINYAADGGLYPELIANRGFDWRTDEPEGWTREWRGDAMGRVSLQGGNPVHPNTWQYLRVECYAPGEGAGVVNSGFAGIAVKQGEKLNLTFYARSHADYAGGLTVSLENAEKKTLASYCIKKGEWKSKPMAHALRASPAPLDPPAPPEWAKYETVLTPSETMTNGHLAILLDARGTVDLELVSLFPQDTYMGRKNGMRRDLMQMLKELKPATLRFPGGCVVEGYNFETLYHWKRTVGPLERRALNKNLWGSWQSHGLGYFEYFQMAEDLGAEPLPILPAGLTCQFRGPEFLPKESLDLVIQDAIDLIEFANGAPETPWGGVRAEMGHPASFKLKYMGIGNENYDEIYLDHYAIIAKAIKAKHPEITLISSGGPFPEGAPYELAWKRLPELKAELVDEHFYRSPEWFYEQVNRYDHFDRKGPKVYVGEYACHTANKNNLTAALAEAAIMTGFERNSDVVMMSAYAPLFKKVNVKAAWEIDMIWFDNARAFGTPSYYVQKLFMNNLPDLLLPIELPEKNRPLPPRGSIGLHTWYTAAEFKDISVKQGDETLYVFDPKNGVKEWSKAEEGSWDVKDGVLRQTDNTMRDTATTVIQGEPWKDYTLALKARKRSGQEGFIIRFRDREQHCIHLNLGGWGNKEHGLEKGPGRPIARKPGSIETDRWYDIKIQLEGERVKVWLDGQPLFDQVVQSDMKEQFYAVAGMDKKANEIVIKCVNPLSDPVTFKWNVVGAKVQAQKVRRTTLSGLPDDVNSFEQPLCVAPREDVVEISNAAPEFHFEPYSLTILRIKVQE